MNVAPLGVERERCDSAVVAGHDLVVVHDEVQRAVVANLEIAAAAWSCVGAATDMKRHERIVVAHADVPRAQINAQGGAGLAPEPELIKGVHVLKAPGGE